MVKQNLIDIIIKEIFSIPNQEMYDINKTVVKHNDNTWISDLLETIVYGTKNNKDYR